MRRRFVHVATETRRVIVEAMSEGLAAMPRDAAIWKAPDPMWRAGRAQAGQG